LLVAPLDTAPPPHTLRPVPTVPVIFASPRFVVIDKPGGLLSVPGKGPDKQDCAAARIRTMFPHATGPLITHRLDMETSGLMVLALDPDAQRDISMQFERRAVEKRYIALLEGLIREDAGLIDLPMRTDFDNRPVQIIDHVHGRPARTHYRVLARETDRTRVEFDLETGRTHQIRLHAAAGLHAPIVGDKLYGAHPAERLMLHACALSFLDPDGARRLEFTSECPF
jgi:tRNA pseudouridine32 synthase/23S rRNA pseudouridine746 synthase